MMITHEISPANPGELPTFTPNESWTLERPREHFYAAAADFAVGALGDGNGRSCLVIGSPIFEAQQLEGLGWKITYLDIRKPPQDVNWVQGDASQMPFADASFDAVSSTCVLCHVGLGRYGDVQRTDGDVLMLKEIKRVLKPGALCALTVGPAAHGEHTHLMGTMHKVYAPVDVYRLAASAGLEVVKTAVWAPRDLHWRGRGELLTSDIEAPDYLSVLLEC